MNALAIKHGLLCVGGAELSDRMQMRQDSTSSQLTVCYFSGDMYAAHLERRVKTCWGKLMFPH